MGIELGASGMILTFGTRSFSVMPAKAGTQGGLRSADEKEKMGIICAVRTTSVYTVRKSEF